MRSIELNIARPVSSKKNRGVKITIGMPTFFMPDFLRYEYEEESGELEIQFVYLGDLEKNTELETGNDVMRVLVGRHTKRIKSIFLKVDREDIHSIDVSVDEWIEDTSEKALSKAQHAYPKMRDNYKVAKEAIDGHIGELAGAISD